MDGTCQPVTAIQGECMSNRHEWHWHVGAFALMLKLNPWPNVAVNIQAHDMGQRPLKSQPWVQSIPRLPPTKPLWATRVPQIPTDVLTRTSSISQQVQLLTTLTKSSLDYAFNCVFHDSMIILSSPKPQHTAIKQPLLYICQRCFLSICSSRMVVSKRCCPKCP